MPGEFRGCLFLSRGWPVSQLLHFVCNFFTTKFLKATSHHHQVAGKSQRREDDMIQNVLSSWKGHANRGSILKTSVAAGTANVATLRPRVLLVLVLMMISAVARVSAAKPPSSSSSFAIAYSVPYSYSVAESISQASSGSFVVGALCSAAAATTPNCSGPATALTVDSSGNIQSQTQYNSGTVPQTTALNILKSTPHRAAIFTRH